MISDDNGIAKEFRSFYANLLGQNSPSLLGINWNELYIPSHSLLHDLNAPYSKEEVSSVIHGLKNYKSRGPNGITMDFFKKFWQSIGDYIVCILNDLQQNPFDMKHMNHATITLIPKRDGADSTGDFHPISLENLKTFYKLGASLRNEFLGLPLSFIRLPPRFLSMAKWTNPLFTRGDYDKGIPLHPSFSTWGFGPSRARAPLLQRSLASFPVKYLGLTLRLGRPLKEDLTQIIGKIDMAMASWQGPLLSRADLRGKCHVNWNVVTASNNKVRLGGWIWKLIRNQGMPWVNIIRLVYPSLPTLPYIVQNNLSIIWRDIMSIRDIFRSYLHFHVGSGASTRLWTDPWLNGNRLCDKYPRLFQLASAPNALIVDSKELNDQGIILGWNILFNNYIDTQLISSLASDLAPILFSSGEDTISWRWCSHGIFSTKSLYNILTFRGISNPTADFIWDSKCPTGVSVTNWLIHKKRLPTNDRLIKRQMQLNQRCSLCNLEDESHDHLFINCEFSKQGWASLLVSSAIVYVPLGLKPWQPDIGTIVSKKIFCINMIWNWKLWHERNNCCFSNSAKSSTKLAIEAFNLVNMCL
ncbi:hypothetical protein Cni_G01962 [Canna indica]|uniref:Reverse transcriptase zinc-binding domain-containing protein n=1 Tax=Canna indica TaxID=4628 RepID=A0AAQ3JP47_9LILI|nr:hypothetical protein Cni_G01962 [Canna indica]